MLKDVVKTTQWVFDQFIPNNTQINSKKSCYNLYRLLQDVIYKVNLVSEHYLALDFTEEYLQNSSIGKPSDKWRMFLNKDLKSLNKTVKKYLLKLYNISTLDNDEDVPLRSYLSSRYNALSFFGFISEEYNIGIVEPCGFVLSSLTLDTSVKETENRFFEYFSKIELSTYEQRVDLQRILREKNEILKNEATRLKSYIEKNITLEELL